MAGRKKTPCEWPDGITIRPDGVHDLDPCVFDELEIVEGATVTLLRCRYCGKIEILWKRPKEVE